MSFRVGSVVFVLAAVLGLAACGGDAATDALAGGDADADFNSDDGSVSFSDGEAEGAMGTDLDTPDWLPSGFPIPDDTNIAMAIQEGEKSVIAGTSTADPEASKAEVQAWFESQGYEIVRPADSNSRGVTGVSPSGEVFDFYFGEDGFELEISNRDVTDDRQSDAEEIETTGQMTTIFGDKTYSGEGICQITGKQYWFQHQSTDGLLVVNLEIFALTEDVTANAFVATFDGEPAQYAMNLPAVDPQPAVETSETSFSISGTFQSMTGDEPVAGSISVDC